MSKIHENFRDLRRDGAAAWARVALMVLALAGGCVNQQKEIKTYRDILDQHNAKPAPLQAGETLTLSRALALANADNEQLAVQGEDYLQSLINKSRVVSTFLPTVSLQPSFAIQQPSNLSQGVLGVSVPPDQLAKNEGYVKRGNTWQRFQAPAVGSMNLAYNNVDNLAAAEQNIQQQHQLLIDAQSTVLLNVAQTYYQILLSEQQVAVLRESLITQEARVRDVEGRYANHLALALEVSQTIGEAAATRVSLTQALSDVRNGRRALAILIAVAAVDGPLADDTAVPDHLSPMEYYVGEAVSHRNDLLAAEAGVRSARAQVDAAIAEYYPSVSLNVEGFM